MYYKTPRVELQMASVKELQILLVGFNSLLTLFVDFFLEKRYKEYSLLVLDKLVKFTKASH